MESSEQGSSEWASNEKEKENCVKVSNAKGLSEMVKALECCDLENCAKAQVEQDSYSLARQVSMALNWTVAYTLVLNEKDSN
jgi:outer membrane receptor for ferrienterochelin and colicin